MIFGLSAAWLADLSDAALWSLYETYGPAQHSVRSPKLFVTAERIRELLHYDAETGVFTRRVSTSSNARAGDVAGSTDSVGYVRIRIDGRLYPAHHLAWVLCTGAWPNAQIDHLNGRRDDNRFCNLREATNADNAQNRQRAQSNNLSTGELGVYWNKAAKKYQAQIKVAGKKKHLGYFDTIEAAVAARAAAELELFPFSTRVCRDSTMDARSRLYVVCEIEARSRFGEFAR